MRKLIFSSLLLFSLASVALTKEEAEDFLLSTLSLPDKADYSEKFYKDNIDASFRAREEMPWGKLVPDREFLHFVLPVRVNNENLDTSRIVFYEELKERVKDLSMEEAILEVNHWCHEHVTYQPSDGRTSSPLSTLSQAIGRCGEESTFTVAALRSVGIPARQIYTPRWAHTDDNHAWVEAWANGKWHFLGACEPEPVLDLGWFNLPASRGILMTTNVAGIYQGEEEILSSDPLGTRINVTSNYAPVAQLPVKVVYPDGSPAEGVNVNFCIYNYAEYYNMVSKKTNSDGKASLNAGLGDIIIWATDGDSFGFAKGNPKDFKDGDDALVVVLDKDNKYNGFFDFDVTPPGVSTTLPIISENIRELNDRKKAFEDSIRREYTLTFVSPESAYVIADEIKADRDTVAKIFKESRGNHQEILASLISVPESLRTKTIDLLRAIKEKDRRDIPAPTVIDHVTFSIEEDNAINLENISPELKDKYYVDYVLNPRIEIEYIRPWRSVLAEGFSPEEKNNFRNNPENLKEWVDKNISINQSENPQRLRMSPIAVWQTREADPLSRNIFFVASARTVGIPARIDPVTANVEYVGSNGEWIKVNFNDSYSGETVNFSGNPDNNSALSSQDNQKGYLNLSFEPDGFLTDPKYYSHFTISQIKDGVPFLLDFDEMAPLSQIFSSPYPLASGQYILTTGQRLADGGVLAHSEIFHITGNDTINIPLTIRQDVSKLSVIGNVNAENIYKDKSTDADKSILSSTGRGYYVLGFISPNHEPSEHALNDISALKNEFEKDGRKIVILFEDEQKMNRFDASRFPSLPENMIFGVDNNKVSANEVTESLHLGGVNYPLFVVADTFNRIVWVSEGYNIGLGEKLISVIKQLE